MKYTHYILQGSPINPEPLGVIAIPAAIVAVPMLLGLLGAAILMDSGRYVRLRYVLHQREQRRMNYWKSVLISLDKVPTNQLIGLLKAA